MPKSLPTMAAVGGTVASQGRPRPTEKKKNVRAVWGAIGSQPISSAREPYMTARMYLLRKRAVLEPAMRLPTMLARPIKASDQLATDGGRPHKFTSPGKCVTRKAM